MRRLFMILCAALLLGAAPTAYAQDEAKTMPAMESIKAGFIYVSPVGDAGWSYAHDQGRQAIEKMKGVETSYVEKVAEGPDSERVLTNMARKGFNVIFATSFGYMDPVQRVSKQFPDTIFMHCSGYKRGDNVGTYFGRMYEARYLTGMVAGAMTKTDKIGYVAAFNIPEVIRGINAFTLGAKAVNPDIEVRVVWSKTWYDPGKEKEAAKSLLDVGCDVITMHQDSPGPQEAAEEAGVWSIGYNTDMAQFAPKAHLTAAVWNWASLYEDIVNKAQSGNWTSEDYWWGMDKGLVDIAPFGDMVPDEVKAAVLGTKADIIAGQKVIFAGPIKNQKGEVVVPEGEAMSDGDMLSMKWFVEGVVGSAE